jgi:hypothetical protein
LSETLSSSARDEEILGDLRTTGSLADDSGHEENQQEPKPTLHEGETCQLLEASPSYYLIGNPLALVRTLFPSWHQEKRRLPGSAVV